VLPLAPSAPAEVPAAGRGGFCGLPNHRDNLAHSFFAAARDFDYGFFAGKRKGNSNLLRAARCNRSAVDVH